MIRFNCDYDEGVHEKIMERLVETNLEQTKGYSEDDYCASARAKIKECCGHEDIDVHFLVGGTQTNLTVIAAALRTYQGVLAAETAHINVHETGSIESCGHKVIVLPSKDGKITARQVEDYYQEHIHNGSFEHMVQPKMVYISNPTELGTIYSKKELEEISTVCRKNELYLFLDGARLGYGLEAKDNDLTLKDLCDDCDVFYIGGTKVGALLGEAVVISNEALKKDFRYVIKQKGGMLAKGRLLGIQFLTLFEDQLYFQISRHADEMAELIRTTLRQAGYSFLVESMTNQIFVIMPDEELEKLGKKFTYSYEKRIDRTHSAVRFCTSWATRKENVELLIDEIKEL